MHDVQIYLQSLGCAKNLVDSEMMAALLQQKSYKLVTDPHVAEVIIVNTCGFIESAKSESIEKLLEMARYKAYKCRALLAAGCLAQRYGEELLQEIPEIDGIFGTNDVYAVELAIRRCLNQERPVYLQGEYYAPDNAPRLLATPAHSAYLKIADGCDNHCTYCAIPAIRGSYRSRSAEAVLEEAEMLAQQGVRELNLVAQDITLYGKDLHNKTSLSELLNRLSQIPDIRWIRLLYAYPERLTDEIIEAMGAHDKICNYLDIPLQHGSDDILQRMGRKTTARQLLLLLDKLRTRIPGIVLRSSFIVGFPQETEKEFIQLLMFLKEAQLDRAGFFAYSQEEGTPAAQYAGQVPHNIKTERVKEAIAVQSVIHDAKQHAQLGRRLEAIADGRSAQDSGIVLLRSYMQAPEVDGYIRVRSQTITSGELLTVKITGYDGYDLLADACLTKQGKHK